MRFSADWLDEGVSVAEELRATACLLEIEVSGRIVSRFVDNRTDRAHNRIAMPAYPPAEGLARVWWSLIAGRSGTISLRHFREGYALPDVRFSPDGRFVNIGVEPFEYDNPPVVFPIGAGERSTIGAFERDAGRFIDAVLERLREEGIDGTWLAERWNAIAESREDADELAFCEAAGALGIDPYLCTEEEADRIEASANSFMGEALPEFLAGCDYDHIPNALDWITEAEVQLGDRAILPNLPGVAQAVRGRVNDVIANEHPWEVGYRAAEDCRRQIGLPVATALQTPSEIADLFDNQHFETAASRARGLRAEVNNSGDEARIVVGGPGRPTSLNFATMRAVGDYLVYQQPGRSPINDTYSYRQAVGRAFAAEMLAPAEVILQMRDNGMSIEDIAAERHVSEWAVTHHLENHDRMQAA